MLAECIMDKLCSQCKYGICSSGRMLTTVIKVLVSGKSLKFVDFRRVKIYHECSLVFQRSAGDSKFSACISQRACRRGQIDVDGTPHSSPFSPEGSVAHFLVQTFVVTCAAPQNKHYPLAIFEDNLSL